MYNILFKFVPLGYLKITLFYFNVTPLQNRVGKRKNFFVVTSFHISIFNPHKNYFNFLHVCLKTSILQITYYNKLRNE